MKVHLHLRLLFALLSVVGSLWLTLHMPSESAFAPPASMPAFDLWHGLIIFGSLALSVVLARLLARS